MNSLRRDHVAIGLVATMLVALGIVWTQRTRAVSRRPDAIRFKSA